MLLWGFYLLYALFFLAVPAGVLYLGLRFVRAQERRAGGGTPLEQLATRVGLLEDRMERLASSVEELAEGQRFTTQLLTERSAASGAASGAVTRPAARPEDR